MILSLLYVFTLLNDLRLFKLQKAQKTWGLGLDMPSHDSSAAQQLLNNSVEVGGSRFNVLDDYCFQANCDNTAEMRWHGFPIKWSDLPTEAKNQLIAKSQLTNTEFRKRLRKSASGE